MVKVLTFKVELREAKNKIWRKIEITDSKTVADLAYTILATFDSLAYHLYGITHGTDRYDCMIEPQECLHYNNLNAVKTKLCELDFSENNKMQMEYDFGSSNIFDITFLNSRDLEKNNGTHYPYIIDGQGSGIMDDIADIELKEIIDDIDKLGYSRYEYSLGYERNKKYDYRDYNIKLDNVLLKGNYKIIKEAYDSKSKDFPK